MKKNVLTAKDLEFTHDLSISENFQQAFSDYVRLLMQNWRQGTVGCKDRSEVAFSNKKPWRQKGTGRARAGTLRSPLWRKGGVIFGPQARVKKLDMNKQMRQQVLRDLLAYKLQKERIIVLDWDPQENAKTSDFYLMLKQVGLHQSQLLLLVDLYDQLTQRSASNLPNVRMISFDQSNAYVLSHGSYWVVLRKDIDLFKQMVSAWN